MYFDQKIIDILKNEDPEGTRVRLLKMDDVQAPPAGTRGTIIAVDDIGSLIVNWDNGSGLNAIPGKDRFRIITEETERGE